MSAIGPLLSSRPLIASQSFVQSLNTASVDNGQTVSGKSESDIRNVIANYLVEKFKNANPNANQRQVEIESERARSDDAILSDEDSYVVANRLGGKQFRPADNWFEKTTGKDDDGKRVTFETITAGSYISHLLSERAD